MTPTAPWSVRGRWSPLALAATVLLASIGFAATDAAAPVRIGIIGKYVSLPDAYLSVVESLRHGGYHHGANVEIDWVQAEEVEGHSGVHRGGPAA